ncbi:MAG: HupE/UreJ family protein, partial [Pseudomonadota bacterium]
MIMLRQIAISLLLFCLNGTSVADEIRPGYLQLKETGPDIFSVIWKVPAKGEKKLGLDVELPANCRDQTRPNTQLVNSAYIQRWIVACEEGLVDKEISISGLKTTNTDVLLHMEFSDGRSESAHLIPTRHTYQVPASS